MTTVAALAMGLPEYDSRLIHGSRISSGQVHEVTLRMLAATRAERAAEPVMHPGRVDVIGEAHWSLIASCTWAGSTRSSSANTTSWMGLRQGLAGAEKQGAKHGIFGNHRPRSRSSRIIADVTAALALRDANVEDSP